MYESNGDEQAHNERSGSTKPLRRIACVRCRKRKKRCDHVIPVCGECAKAGLQCVQSGVTPRGSAVTVPLAYLRQLQQGISQGSSRPSSSQCDVSTTNDINQTNDSTITELESGTAYPSPGGVTVNDTEEHAASATALSVSDDRVVPAVLEDSRFMTRNQPLEEMRVAAPSRIILDSEEVHLLPPDWAEHYASMYWKHIQPQWPFMDSTTWDHSFAMWLQDPASLSSPIRFLVKLVLSVGALVCSSFRLHCPHLKNSQGYYRSALQHDLSELTRSTSMLLRTQGALILLIHDFHESSPDSIHQSLKLAMMNCISLIAEPCNSYTSESESEIPDGQEVRQRVIMSCHILNEVVSSGWTYPPDTIGEIADQKLLQQISRIQPYQDRNSVFDHLFRLRCIQSRIRHHSRTMKHLDLDDPLRRRCYLSLKAELEDWKRSVQAAPHPSPSRGPIYHTTSSLFKLYDYSLVLLLQDKPLMTVVENMNELVRCCSEACCTFQASQEHDSAVYWTWASLMYQFRLGILVLYCYWIASLATQDAEFPLQEAILGLQNCRKTLYRFSVRWPKSVVFLDTFQILADSICDGTLFSCTGDAASVVDYATDPSLTQLFQTPTGTRIFRLEECVAEMKMAQIHFAVLSMIQEMLIGIQSRENDPSQSQLAPVAYSGGLNLFDF